MAWHQCAGIFYLTLVVCQRYEMDGGLGLAGKTGEGSPATGNIGVLGRLVTFSARAGRNHWRVDFLCCGNFVDPGFNQAFSVSLVRQNTSVTGGGLSPVCFPCGGVAGVQLLVTTGGLDDGFVAGFGRDSCGLGVIRKGRCQTESG